ncbi:hypothetical protein HMPREF9205_0514 [Cutibacterium acnes SK182]|nr:hypothetical protein HMPREF9205_0514 [Cutibacterium acnes SK182]
MRSGVGINAVDVNGSLRAAQHVGQLGEVVGHRSHPSSITVPILPLSRTSKPGDTDKTITIS